MPGATFSLALTSGNTVYMVLLDQAGQIYRPSTSGFEEPVAGTWANYAITMTEAGTTGIYRADMPAVIAGNYSLIGYRRVGGTPAPTDAVVGLGEVRWTGTSLEPVWTTAHLDRIAGIPSIANGTALGGGTATTFPITGPGLNATTDAYKGHQIFWQSGGLVTERRSVTAHTVSGSGPTAIHTITVGSPFTAAPAGGDLCTLP